MGGVAEVWGVGEALVGEGEELLEDGEAVVDDEARHGSAAGLCPHGLHLESAAGADVELRLEDLNLVAHASPVEEVLELLGSEMDEDAVVGFHAIDEHIGEA